MNHFSPPPLIEELRPAPSAEEAFRRLNVLSHCLFLDSAAEQPTIGEHSFLAADPFEFVELPADGTDALGVLAGKMRQYAAPREKSNTLPPFQGGAAGLWGYELGRSLERLPAPRFDEFRLPALAVGFYDVVVAWDHLNNQAWIISQGFPETEPHARRRRAQQRLRYFRAIIEGHELPAANAAVCQPPDERVSIKTPQRPIAFAPGMTSNFSRDEYLAAVARAIEYIRAGDVFQVNLSQRLLHPASDDSREVYHRLRRLNPAPMAGYFDLGRTQIISASPERFLRVEKDRVETWPIKGTRPRSGNRQLDRAAAAELAASEKDRAENVMIVDLLRNDLSKSCLPDSVRVERLCGVEAFRHVLHLVSVVSGTLREECSLLDLLRGAFPGGSITGAPKPRAMEIITELEGVARGAYCGSLGYLGFDGTMDASILIRTITAGGGWLQLPVGGGIVAQSTPEGEYDETWHKAEGMLQAL